MVLDIIKREYLQSKAEKKIITASNELSQYIANMDLSADERQELRQIINKSLKKISVAFFVQGIETGTRILGGGADELHPKDD